MIYIGNHVSMSRGFLAMGEHEKELGGDTFAFFTRNPRGGTTKELDHEDVEALKAFLKREHFGRLVAHAPYTMNLCSSKPEIREYAKNVFQEDLRKMESLPGNFFNFHPGAHTGQGAEAGVQIIADVLNESLSPDQSTIVLLETMAGKGTEVGRTFEELRQILDLVKPELLPKMGVCLDTCHVWDAGYDIVHDLDGVLQHFDEVIGIDRLYAVHLNDSMNPCGAHKDRHQKLGKGEIGLDALLTVVHHPLLQGRPFILETPNEDPGYKKEIAEVKASFEADHAYFQISRK
jgi:deoxyribonuclease-4